MNAKWRKGYTPCRESVRFARNWGSNSAAPLHAGQPEMAVPQTLLCHSDAIEEEWCAQFGGVVGPIPLGIVESGNVHFARAQGRSGKRSMGVTAVLYADHAAKDAVAQHVNGDVGEGDGHELIDRVGLAAAQIVSQVADHDFIAGTLADL